MNISRPGLFDETSALADVLRVGAGKAVVDRFLPGLSSSTKLHTLFGYPVGLVAKTDEILGKNPEGLEAFLDEIRKIPLGEEVAPAPRTPVSHSEDVAYQDPDEPGSAQVSAPSAGEVYRRIEVALRGPRSGNPYTSVVLEALVETPGGTVRVPGFYDGDGVYKLRWLPERPGRYTFTTRSNARSLEGVTGSVDVGESVHGHGPVRVADKFHFAYADGVRYLPIGTTSYAWVHQPERLQDQTVEQLSRSPFNKMRMCLFPKSYLFNDNEPDDFPYVRGADGRFDYETFDPAFWHRLEHRIDQLAELGVEADLILFHAYDRWGFSAMTASADDQYVRYVVARLASFANVWWSLANEFDLLFEKSIEDWERFAAIVTRDDPSAHLLSIHNCHEPYDQSRPWVTHVSIQRLDVYKTAESMGEWRSRWSKPVVLDETGYEGDIDQGWGNLTGEELVRRFWEGTVRGGYVGHGETYLDPEDVLWWSKGGLLKGSSPARIGFLREIVESAPGGVLEPNTIDWDVPRAGVEDEYYLYYFGFGQPGRRSFIFDPETSYHLDVIDTWSMTIERLPGIYSGRFTVDLPGRQYIALRMTRVE